MQEKIWVVVQQDCNGIASVLAFDYEADAQNFAQEMTAMGKGTNTVTETTINRRHEAEEAIARVDLPEFNTECIECIIDMSDVPEDKQDAAARYLEEHRCDLQKDAQKMVDKYIKKAITDFFADERIILG
ncbi:hypothetical protein [Cloacibacillus sp.]